MNPVESQPGYRNSLKNMSPGNKTCLLLANENWEDLFQADLTQPPATITHVYSVKAGFKKFGVMPPSPREASGNPNRFPLRSEMSLES